MTSFTNGRGVKRAEMECVRTGLEATPSTLGKSPLLFQQKVYHEIGSECEELARD